MNFKKLFRCSPNPVVITHPIGSVIACWAKDPKKVIDNNGIGINEWKGWALCDGRDNRPDLRGRFLLGAGQKPNPIKMGSQGGRSETTLQIDDLPKHIHNVTIIESGAHDHSNQKTALADNDDFDGTGNYIGSRSDGSHGDVVKTITKDGSDHTHDVKETHVGKNNPIEIMPPYKGVFFMIKI